MTTTTAPEAAEMASGTSADSFIEVEVTIETTTEEKAIYRIDRADFAEWSGGPITDQSVKGYLRAGDEWEVCAAVHGASRETPTVVDCSVLSVRLVRPIEGKPSEEGDRG